MEVMGKESKGSSDYDEGGGSSQDEGGPIGEQRASDDGCQPGGQDEQLASDDGNTAWKDSRSCTGIAASGRPGGGEGALELHCADAAAQQLLAFDGLELRAAAAALRLSRARGFRGKGEGTSPPSASPRASGCVKMNTICSPISSNSA